MADTFVSHHPAIGRFESSSFDPPSWKARVPAAALRHAQPDDLFWAARRVTAFSDEMIRALAQTAAYTDPGEARYLADTLIQRRHKIATAYLNAVTPLVGFSLSADGHLSFDNAAVRAGVATPPHGGYDLTWAFVDNRTAAVEIIGTTRGISGEPSPAPASVREPPEGSLVRVRVTAVEPPVAWQPIDAYFRQAAGGWKLVGLDRDTTLEQCGRP